jgi:hypothetical protein
MIVVDWVRYRGLLQIRKNGSREAICRAADGGAVAGVVGDGGDRAGGGVGDGGVDGDLVEVLVVEGPDVEGLVELQLEARRGAGEQVSEVRQGVEQGGVGGSRGRLGEVG